MMVKASTAVNMVRNGDALIVGEVWNDQVQSYSMALTNYKHCRTDHVDLVDDRYLDETEREAQATLESMAKDDQYRE